jgi:hypothetical protein
VKIRNLRLVLDGHAVALPYANILNPALRGDQTSEGNPLLESGYVWLRFDLPGDDERTVLGKTVQVPMRLAGLAQLRSEDAAKARTALDLHRGRPACISASMSDRATSPPGYWN